MENPNQTGTKTAVYRRQEMMHVMGISSQTLARYVESGVVPQPLVDPSSGYRAWTSEQVDQAIKNQDALWAERKANKPRMSQARANRLAREAARAEIHAQHAWLDMAAHAAAERQREEALTTFQEQAAKTAAAINGFGDIGKALRLKELRTLYIQCRATIAAAQQITKLLEQRSMIISQRQPRGTAKKNRAREGGNNGKTTNAPI